MEVYARKHWSHEKKKTVVVEKETTVQVLCVPNDPSGNICKYEKCRFAHVCSECFKGHPKTKYGAEGPGPSYVGPPLSEPGLREKTL